MLDNNTKLVVIGGGTGTSAVLGGLKNYTNSLTAIVNMVDNGGSSGVLRSEHGLLPPGDIRQCLVALSRANLDKQKMFGYRYENGFLQGHSFGNLFLSTAEKMTGDFIKAVAMASEFLEVTGKVMPVTLDDAHLHLSPETEGAIQGQSQIDGSKILDPNNQPSFTLSLSPPAKIYAAAREALENADCIIIAPGDLYTSLAPLLLVEGVVESISQSHATLIYVSNLTTKEGHTTGYSVQDHATAIEKLLSTHKTTYLDHVIYNIAAGPLPHDILKDGEQLVAFKGGDEHYKSHGHNLISKSVVVHKEGDALRHRRSRIRHDADALARAIIEIL
jgi:uncharacterized cofD-like protein